MVFLPYALFLYEKHRWKTKLISRKHWTFTICLVIGSCWAQLYLPNTTVLAENLTTNTYGKSHSSNMAVLCCSRLWQLERSHISKLNKIILITYFAFECSMKMELRPTYSDGSGTFLAKWNLKFIIEIRWLKFYIKKYGNFLFGSITFVHGNNTNVYTVKNFCKITSHIAVIFYITVL